MRILSIMVCFVLPVSAHGQDDSPIRKVYESQEALSHLKISSEGDFLAAEVGPVQERHMRVWSLSENKGESETPVQVFLPGEKGAQGFSWSSHQFAWHDGQVGVFSASTRGQARRLYVIQAKVSMASEFLTQEKIGGDLSLPVFSKDKSLLAFVKTQDGMQDLYLYESKSDTVHRLTNDGQPKDSMVFSPNGDHVIYTVENEESGETDLWKAATKPVEAVLKPPVSDPKTQKRNKKKRTAPKQEAPVAPRIQLFVPEALMRSPGNEFRPQFIGETLWMLVRDGESGGASLATLSKDGNLNTVVQVAEPEAFDAVAISPSGEWWCVNPSTNGEIQCAPVDGGEGFTIATGLDDVKSPLFAKTPEGAPTELMFLGREKGGTTTGIYAYTLDAQVH